MEGDRERKCPVCGAPLSYNPWLRRYEDADWGTRHYCYLEARQLTANIQECTCGDLVLVYSDRKLNFDSRTRHLCSKRAPAKRPRRGRNTILHKTGATQLVHKD